MRDQEFAQSTILLGVKIAVFDDDAVLLFDAEDFLFEGLDVHLFALAMRAGHFDQQLVLEGG